MIYHNAMYNIDTMKTELCRVLESLKAGNPVPSHIWLIIKHPGIAKGEWTTDNLENYLDHLIQQTPGATVYTVWSDTPDINPMLDAQSTVRNETLAEDGTLINIMDFILAGKDKVKMKSLHHDMLIKIVTYAWRHLVNAEPAMVSLINKALINNH